MEPRFVVDVNVGRLAKWLRVMGYDALFVPDVDDRELLRIGKEEGRVVLTRDRRIMERRIVASEQVKVLLIMSDDFREQMRYVAATLGLSACNDFSRCIECNQPLRNVCKQRVSGIVPPYVFSTQEQFYQCPKCARLYWRGTHWRNMRVELNEFLKGT